MTHPSFTKWLSLRTETSPLRFGKALGQYRRLSEIAARKDADSKLDVGDISMGFNALIMNIMPSPKELEKEKQKMLIHNLRFAQMRRDTLKRLGRLSRADLGFTMAGGVAASGSGNVGGGGGSDGTRPVTGLSF